MGKQICLYVDNDNEVIVVLAKSGSTMNVHVEQSKLNRRMGREKIKEETGN